MIMEIGKEKAAIFEKVETSALRVIQEYLDGERQGGDDVVTARCTLSVIKGNRQAAGAMQALGYGMARDLQEPKILKKYVKVTNPEIKKLM